jgi:hypothetical protein
MWKNITSYQALQFWCDSNEFSGVVLRIVEDIADLLDMFLDLEGS